MSKIRDALDEAQAKQEKWGNAWDEYRVGTFVDVILAKAKRTKIGYETSHSTGNFGDFYDSLADLKCYTDELIRRLDKE